MAWRFPYQTVNKVYFWEEAENGNFCTFLYGFTYYLCN